MQALNPFLQNISLVRDMVGTGRTFAALAPLVNVEEIFRSAYAMSVSALDLYVHEAVLEGMLDVAQGARPAMPSYRQFGIRLEAAHAAQLSVRSQSGSVGWLAREIRELNGRKSFQTADAIADGLRPFTSFPLWPTVAESLGRDVGALKGQLNLIVDRRNKIVHEFDYVPNGLGQRWFVDDVIVSATVDTVEEIVKAIDALL